MIHDTITKKSSLNKTKKKLSKNPQEPVKKLSKNTPKIYKKPTRKPKSNFIPQKY
jgi:hypothetical protein